MVPRNRFPEYASAVFAETAKRKSPFIYFFEQTLSANLQKSVFPSLDLLRLRQVLIPAELAHPSGWFFYKLSRPECIKALFISFCGQRNPRMCTSCIQTYSCTLTSVKEHVLFPFHECISLPNATDGSCSNCVWNGSQAVDCEWRAFPGYRLKAKDKGVMTSPFAGKNWDQSVPDGKEPEFEYMNLRDAPRLLCDVPNPWDNKVLEGRALAHCRNVARTPRMGPTSS